MRRSLLVLAMTPVLLATQCFPRFDLRTSPGPEPMQVVFTGVRGHERVELQSVTVTRCRPAELAHTVWEAGGKGAEEVPYGSDKLDSPRPAEPLFPGGCYNVFARGRLETSSLPAFGSGGFRVLPDSTVVEGTGAEGRRLAAYRQVDRAYVNCRRDYRRARTPVDTARVDLRVWEVSDTTLTCGFLRTRFGETMERTESTERVMLETAGALAAIAALLAFRTVLGRAGL
ncbi:MAG TPA: hypothetical protein VJT67_09645 [Longimicrobiaceae bacterium]|nr:hypothetical protein [Longimicrobiaceae bacterium]